MASNSIAEYLKKLGKSVKYAATEALSDQMPVASKFAVTAKDTVKDTYKYLVDSRIVNNRFGSIKNNTIYKQVNQGLSNLKADITSGQFYNPEREDIGSMMEMIMGALGDDSEIFASDLEEISAPEHDKEAAANDERMMLTKGDAMIASSIIKVHHTSTNAIGKLLVKLNESRADQQRALEDQQFLFGQRQFALERSGFDAMAQGFNSIIEFNNKVLKTHVENSQKFFEEITKIQRDNNAILHTLHDIQNKTYHSLDPKENMVEAIHKVPVNDLFKDGISPKTYYNIIKSRMEKAPLGAAFQFIGLLPMMMQEYVTNPMHHITKYAIEGVMGGAVREAMARFDKTIAGTFSTALARMYDYGKEHGDSLLGKIATKLGVKQEKIEFGKLDTSKFNKGPMPYNGLAQKSIVEVIPGYLSRIEAALTGNGERLFDMKSGKWLKPSRMKNYEKNIDSKLNQEAHGNIEKRLHSAARTMNFATPEDEKQFHKSINEYFNAQADRGSFDPDYALKHPEKYVKDNPNLAALITQMEQSLATTDELLGLTRSYAEAHQKKIDMVNGKNANDTILQNLISNANVGAVEPNKIGMGKAAVSPAFNLTIQTDKRGMTLYDYQYRILQRLYQMEGFGGGRGRGRRRGGNGNPPSGSSDKFENIIKGYQDQYAESTKDKSEDYRAPRVDQEAVRNRTLRVDSSRLNIERSAFENRDKNTKVTMEDFAKNTPEAKKAIEEAAKLIEKSRENTHKKKVGEYSNLLDFLSPKAPSDFVVGAIGWADKAIFNLLFKSELNSKDSQGNPIHGVAQLMGTRFEEIVNKANSLIDEYRQKLIDKLSGDNGFLASAKKFVKKQFGFDIDAALDKAKSTAEKTVKGVGVNLKDAAKETFKDVVGSVRDTFKDARSALTNAYGSSNITGKNWSFASAGELHIPAEINPYNPNRKSNPSSVMGRAKSIKTSGLIRVKPGDAIVRADQNPFNRNRNTVDVDKQQANEEKMRADFALTGKTKLATEGLPSTNAQGTAYQSDLNNLIKDFNTLGLTAKELNAVTQASSKEQARQSVADIIRAHANSKNIFSIKRKLVDLLNRIWRPGSHSTRADIRGITGKIMRLGGFGEDNGQVVLNDTISQEAKDKLLSQENLQKQGYVQLNQYREAAGHFGQNIGTNEEIDQNKFAGKQGPVTGFRQFMLAAFGSDPKKAAQMAGDTIIRNKKAAAKGTIGGSLLSAVLPLGGPLMGAVVGAASSILADNETVKKYLFGEMVTDANGNQKRQGGLISRRIMDIFEKYSPDAKKYGTTGAIAGLLTGFGPLGGAMIGVGASVIKNNKTLSNVLFGDGGGLLNKDRKARIKKALPHMGTAMLGTFFLGPFGLLGNAVLGAGIGLVSTTESFKSIMLGAKGRDGVRRGGLAGAIRRQIVNPFKETMKEVRDKFAYWFRDKIVTPIGKGISPLGKLAGSMLKQGFQNLFKSVGRTVRGTFVGRLADRGLAGIRNLGAFAKGGLQKVIGMPAEWAAGKVEQAGQWATKYALKNGYTDLYSAQDIADASRKFNMAGNVFTTAKAITNKDANGQYEISDKKLENLAKLSKLYNAQLTGGKDALNKELTAQNQEERNYFENDLMKIEESIENSGVQIAFNNLNWKIKQIMSDQSILPEKAYKQITEAIEGFDIDLDAEGRKIVKESKLKDKVRKQARKSLATIRRNNRKAEAVSTGNHLDKTRTILSESLGLDGITTEGFDKDAEKISRTLTNEITYRRNQKEEEEAAKKNGSPDLINITDEVKGAQDNPALKLQAASAQSNQKALSALEVANEQRDKISQNIEQLLEVFQWVAGKDVDNENNTVLNQLKQETDVRSKQDEIAASYEDAQDKEAAEKMDKKRVAHDESARRVAKLGRFGKLIHYTGKAAIAPTNAVVGAAKAAGRKVGRKVKSMANKSTGEKRSGDALERTITSAIGNDVTAQASAAILNHNYTDEGMQKIYGNEIERAADNGKFTWEKFQNIDDQEKRAEFMVYMYKHGLLDDFFKTVPEGALDELDQYPIVGEYIRKRRQQAGPMSFFAKKDAENEKEQSKKNNASNSISKLPETHALGSTILGGLKSIGSGISKVGGIVKNSIAGAMKEKLFGDKKKDQGSEQQEVVQPVTIASPAVSNALAASAATKGGANVNNPMDKSGEFTVSTAEGDIISYGKSKTDGQPMVIPNKNNMNVLAKQKHKMDLQERSTKALEAMAENAKPKIGKVANKASGGLFDALKDLLMLPKNLLNTLIPGLGAGLYAVAGFIGGKIMGGIKSLAGKAFGAVKSLLAPGFQAVKKWLGQGFSHTFKYLKNFGVKLLSKLGTPGKILAGIGAAIGLATNARGNQAIGYTPAYATAGLPATHAYGGLIDDTTQHTVGASSTMAAAYARTPNTDSIRTDGMMPGAEGGRSIDYGDLTFDDNDMNFDTPAYPGNQNQQPQKNKGIVSDNAEFLASIPASIYGATKGYKIGKNFGHRHIGGGIGATIADSAIHFANTGELPSGGDLAANLAMNTAASWGVSKLSDKWNGFTGPTAEQAAKSAAEKTTPKAAFNPLKYISKLGTKGKVAAGLLGAFGLSRLFGGNDEAQAQQAQMNNPYQMQTAGAPAMMADAYNNPQALPAQPVNAITPQEAQSDNSGSPFGTVAKLGAAGGLGYLGYKAYKDYNSQLAESAAANKAKYETNQKGLAKLRSQMDTLSNSGAKVNNKLMNRMAASETKLLENMKAAKAAAPTASVGKAVTNTLSKLGTKGKFLAAGLGLYTGSKLLSSNDDYNDLSPQDQRAAMSQLNPQLQQLAMMPHDQQLELMSQLPPEQQEAINAQFEQAGLATPGKREGSIIADIGGFFGGRALASKLGGNLGGRALGGSAGSLIAKAMTGGDITAGDVASTVAINTAMEGAMNGADALYGNIKDKGLRNGLSQSWTDLKQYGSNLKSKGVTGIVKDQYNNLKTMGSNAKAFFTGAPTAAPTNAVSDASGAAKNVQKDAELAAKTSEIVNGAKDKLDKLGKLLAKVLPDGAVKIFSNLSNRILEHLMKPDVIAKGLAKLTTRQAASLAAGASTAGVGYIVLTAGFALKDFYDGYTKTEEILGIEPETATTGMKIVCGIINALVNSIPIIGPFLPAEQITKWVVEMFGPFFGFDKSKLGKAKQGEDTEGEEVDKGLNSYSQGGATQQAAPTNAISANQSDNQQTVEGTPIGDASNNKGNWYSSYFDNGKDNQAATPEAKEDKTAASKESIDQINSRIKDDFAKIADTLSDKFNEQGRLEYDVFCTRLTQAVDKAGSDKIDKAVGAIKDKSSSNSISDASNVTKLFENGKVVAAETLGKDKKDELSEEAKNLAGIIFATYFAMPYLENLIDRKAFNKLATDTMGLSFHIDGDKNTEKKDAASQRNKTTDTATNANKNTSLFDTAKDYLSKGVSYLPPVLAYKAANAISSTSTGDIFGKKSDEEVEATKEALYSKIRDTIERIVEILKDVLSENAVEAVKGFGEELIKQIDRTKAIEGSSKLNDLKRSLMNNVADTLSSVSIKQYNTGKNNTEDMLGIKDSPEIKEGVRTLSGILYLIESAMPFITNYIDKQTIRHIAFTYLGPELDISEDDMKEIKKDDKYDNTEQKMNTVGDIVKKPITSAIDTVRKTDTFQWARNTTVGKYVTSAVNTVNNSVDKADIQLLTNKILDAVQEVAMAIQKYIPSGAFNALKGFGYTIVDDITKSGSFSNASMKLLDKMNNEGTNAFAETIGSVDREKAQSEFAAGTKAYSQMFDIPAGAGNEAVKTLAGIVTAIYGSISYIDYFIRQPHLIDLALKNIGPALGIDKNALDKMKKNAEQKDKEDKQKAENENKEYESQNSFGAKVKKASKGILSTIIDTTSKVTNSVSEGISSLVDTAKNSVSGAWDFIKDTVNGVTNKITNSDTYKSIHAKVDELTNKASQAVEDVKQTGSDIIDAGKNKLRKVLGIDISKDKNTTGKGNPVSAIDQYSMKAYGPSTEPMMTTFDLSKYGKGKDDQGFSMKEMRQTLTSSFNDLLSKFGMSKYGMGSVTREKMWALANYVSPMCDIPPELIYGQWTQEAGQDFDANAELSSPAYYNFGGIGYDGNDYTKFGSPEEFAEYYASDKVYSKAYGARDARQMAEMLYQNHYFTGNHPNDDEANISEYAAGIQAGVDNAKKLKLDMSLVDTSKFGKNPSLKFSHAGNATLLQQQQAAANQQTNGNKKDSKMMEMMASVGEVVQGIYNVINPRQAKKPKLLSFGKGKDKNDVVEEYDKEEEKNAKEPEFGMGGKFFSQLDPAIANTPFNAKGDTVRQTAKDSWCGPASAANARSALGLSANPAKIANSVISHNEKEKNGGSKPEGLEQGIRSYGDADTQRLHTKSSIIDSLKKGNPVILMGTNKSGKGTPQKEDTKSPYGNNPHYITATGISKSGKLIVQDSESHSPNKLFEASPVIDDSNVAIGVKRKENIKNTSSRKAKPSVFGRAKSAAQSILRRAKSAASSFANSKPKTNSIYNAPKYGRGKFGQGGEDNKPRIWQYLIEKKFSNQAAAGVIGNLMVESGTNCDPTIGEIGQDAPRTAEEALTKNGGFGICQWTANYNGESISPERVKGLIAMAKAENKPTTDLYVQLDFAMKELGERKECLDGLNKAKTATEACDVWLEYFEGVPSTPSRGEREKNAEDILKQYGNGQTNTSTIDLGALTSQLPGAGPGGGGAPHNVGLMGALTDAAALLMDALQMFDQGSQQSSSVAGAPTGKNGDTLASVVETNLSFSGDLSPLGKPERIAIHHTGPDGVTSAEQEASVDPSAAEIHEMHKSKGWGGIGYHFVIRKNGSIERGRPEDKLGTHVYHNNTGTLGIHVGGHFDYGKPTDAQVKSLTGLLRDLCSKYGIPADRQHIMGHKEFPENADTACPGSNMMSILDDIVKNVASAVTASPASNPAAPKDEKSKNGKGKFSDRYSIENVSPKFGTGKEEEESITPDNAKTVSIMDSTPSKTGNDNILSNTIPSKQPSKVSNVFGKAKGVSNRVQKAVKSAYGMAKSLPSIIRNKVSKFGKGDNYLNDDGTWSNDDEILFNHDSENEGALDTSDTTIGMDNRTQTKGDFTEGQIQSMMELNGYDRETAIEALEWGEYVRTHEGTEADENEVQVEANEEKGKNIVLSQNDIDYLMENGYSKEEAIKFLQEDHKKKVQEEADKKKQDIIANKANTAVMQQANAGPTKDYGVLGNLVMEATKKVATPVAKIMRSFGKAIYGAVTSSPMAGMIKQLFGDDNPLLQAAGWTAPEASGTQGPGGAYSGNVAQGTGRDACAIIMSMVPQFEITGEFGEIRKGGAKHHAGIDFGCAGLPKIPTPTAGKVVMVNTDGDGGGYGNFVWLQDSSGVLHLFAHLSSVEPGISKDTQVPRGGYVGTMGSSGGDYGPHLHYQIDPSDNLSKGYPIGNDSVPHINPHEYAPPDAGQGTTPNTNNEQKKDGSGKYKWGTGESLNPIDQELLNTNSLKETPKLHNEPNMSRINMGLTREDEKQINIWGKGADREDTGYVGFRGLKFNNNKVGYKCSMYNNQYDDGFEIPENYIVNPDDGIEIANRKNMEQEKAHQEWLNSNPSNSKYGQGKRKFGTGLLDRAKDFFNKVKDLKNKYTGKSSNDSIFGKIMHDAMHPTGIFGHINKKQDTGYDQYYPADTSDNPEVFAPSIEGMKAAGITIVPEKSNKKEDNDKEIKYADEVAPNGEHYDENDIDYLVNLPAADNGFKYDRKSAIEELSKIDKYTKKPEEKPKTSNTISEINEAKKEEDQDNKDIQIVRDSEEKAKNEKNKKENKKHGGLRGLWDKWKGTFKDWKAKLLGTDEDEEPSNVIKETQTPPIAPENQKKKEYLEEVAPNGKHYEKNDLDYLLNLPAADNGFKYTKESALAELAKSDKYTKKETNAVSEAKDKNKDVKYAEEVAPNGEHYTQNDIDYLVNLPKADNGFKYDRTTALQELAKSDKYTKKTSNAISDAKDTKYIEEVAPNGEHYSENDLNYLLNLPAADNGFKYTRETALEELSKSKKYAKKSEDKNKNLADIIDKISKRAQAIQGNGNEIVIAEDADTAQELADNIDAAEEAIPYPIAKAPIQNQPVEEDEEQEENTDYGTGKDNTETKSAQPVQQSTIDDSSSKLDALLQAQNKTNELLSGIFQFLQVAVKSIGSNGNSKSAEKPVMSTNTHTKETPTTMATRTIIATNQNTGIGDFSGDASKDFSDIQNILKAMNFAVSR